VISQAPMPPPSPERRLRLERLLAKYRALAELRARREQLQAEGGDHFQPEEAASRRAAFRTLAHEFPGCLRELDSVTEVKLRQRAEHLARLLDDPEQAEPPWVPVTEAYHATLREALAIKRWLAHRLPRGGAIAPELVADFSRWYARLPFARSGAHTASAEHLARHLNPPGGRLQSLIWEELVQRFGRPRAELEREIFSR